MKYFLNLYKVTCQFSSYKNHFIIKELGSYFPVKIKYKNKIPKIINIITDKHPKENILNYSTKLKHLNILLISVLEIITIFSNEKTGGISRYFICLIKELIKYKIDYILTREPGGTKTGEEIRKIILDKENETDELSDS